MTIYRTTTPKRYPALFLTLILVMISFCSLGAEGARIVYRDGLLSADIVAVDIDTALEQTAAETDVVFSLSPGAGLTETISARFSDQNLENGIRQLLVGYNYMMLYATTESGDKRISKVIVLGKAASAPAGSSTVAGTATAPAVVAPVVLHRDRSGHYTASGSINDRPAEFIVDTGATVVALSAPTAKRIGLGFGKAKRIETASGTTTGYGTVLERVELGGLFLDQVPAVILPEMNLGERVLLGMSFLGSFNLIQRNDLLTIAPRTP